MSGKNTIILYLSVLFCTLSCSQNNEVEIKPFLEMADSYRNIQLTQKAEVVYATLKSNVEFSVSSSEPSWCQTQVLPSKKEGNLQINIKANNSISSREAEITVSANGVTPLKLAVRQMGEIPEIRVDNKNIELTENKNLDFTLDITTNIAIDIDYPKWITRHESSESKTMATTTLTFSADPMEGKGARQGEIIIKAVDPKSSAIPVRVAVKQMLTGEIPRFAVLSDIHIGTADAKEKVARALQMLIAQSPRVDAIFIPGDLTNNGEAAQYADLQKLFAANIPADLPVYFMMGNHDRYSGGVAISNYSVLGQSLHQYIEIGGHPFITISSSSGANSGDTYDNEAKQFLTHKLKTAAAKFPGKPIFVFFHVPVAQTVYGTTEAEGYWGATSFSSILVSYPQVIAFSGHTHYPLGDPRSIHQDKFTSINDGSTAYAEMGPGLTGGTLPPNYSSVTEAVIVTVKENKDVEISRYDTYRKEEILPKWLIATPHNGSAFAYKGRTGGLTPKFESGTKPIVSQVNTHSANITFAQATDDDVVYAYKIEIEKESSSEVVSRSVVFSLHYLNSLMPKTLSQVVNSLESGITYRARVTAIDSYNNQSEAIVSEPFTTEVYIPDPAVVAPVADLFDIGFTANGKAYDYSPLKNSILQGKSGDQYTPKTQFNPTLNNYTAVFSPSGSTTETFFKLDFENNQKLLSAMENEFTIESYICTGNKNNTCPYGAQENGGMGLEVNSDSGLYEFWIHIGGSYKQIQTAPALTSSYTHIVCVYNKSAGKVYSFVNGTPSGERTVSGNYSHAYPTARWLCIGGDATLASRGHAQYAFTGDIVFLRMYGKALNQDEAFRLHEQTETRKNRSGLRELNTLLSETLVQKKAVALAASNTHLATKIEHCISKGWYTMANYAASQADVDAVIAEARSY